MTSLFKKKLSAALGLALIMLVMLNCLIDNYTSLWFINLNVGIEKKGDSIIPILKDSTSDVINKIDDNTFVIKQARLKAESANRFIKIIAPGKPFLADNLYCLLILSICIVFLIRMNRYDPEKPFSPMIVSGIKWSSVIVFLFWILDYIRLLVIDKYVISITKNEYRLEKYNIQNLPLLWIGILFLFLYRVLKKAEVIQREQDLTV